MNLWVPWNAGNLASWGTISFSRTALMQAVSQLTVKYSPIHSYVSAPLPVCAPTPRRPVRATCSVYSILLEICALLGYHAAHSSNLLPTFRDNLSVTLSRVKKSKKKFILFFLDFLTLEDEADMLSRNVGNKLPPHAVQYPRRAHIPSFRGGSLK